MNSQALWQWAADWQTCRCELEHESGDSARKCRVGILSQSRFVALSTIVEEPQRVAFIVSEHKVGHLKPERRLPACMSCAYTGAIDMQAQH